MIEQPQVPIGQHGTASVSVFTQGQVIPAPQPVPATYLQIDGHRQWVLVRDYHDGSGLLNVYGPFESEDAATSAIDVLRDVGLENRFTAVPLWRISSGVADT